MITKAKKNFKELILNVLSNDLFSKMSKPRKYFVAHTMWLFASVKGRINFLQLGRFSKFCEQYFRIGFQKSLDFLSFNSILLKKTSLWLNSISYITTGALKITTFQQINHTSYLCHFE